MTMALREAFAVLCILSIVVSPAICANDTNPVCNPFNSSNIPSSNAASNGSFQITVSPSTLTASTVYTVTVNGSGNVSVILQAISNSSSVGIWSSANGCNGSLSYGNPFQNSSNPIVANWTSPNNISSVLISAQITGETNVTISTLLSNAPANNQSTPSPSVSTNTTATTAPSVSVNTTSSTNTTATTGNTTLVSKVTSAGSAKHPSFILMALIEIFGFTLITSRLLS